MTEPPRGRFLRDNIFLVAAIALPLAVIGFFLLASAIPQWTVPPPAYDLVVKAGGPFNQAPRLMVDFLVRQGRVEAHVRPVPANGYPQPATLFLYEHETGRLAEIPVELPTALAEGDPPQDIPISALADRRVVTTSQSPDGYRLEHRPRRGPGIVGELFGMNRYDHGAALVNGGRVVPLTLPLPHQYLSPVTAVGWVVPEGGR
jgi:hypothetical protein